MARRLLIKLSGKVLDSEVGRRTLAEELAVLRNASHQLVVTHGGGAQLSAFCRRLGIPVQQIQGRRVTDKATLEAAIQVFGQINAELTATLQICGVPAVGIPAFAGGLVSARRRPPIEVHDGQEVRQVDFGLVGDVNSVDPSLVRCLWQGGFLPVISCLCSDETGRILNVNADTLAVELAVALGVDRLVAVTDVDGLYLDLSDPTTQLHRLSPEEALDYLEQGVFRDGMVPKVENALGALERGLPSFQILRGDLVGHLRRCLEDDVGTLITGTPARPSR